MTSPDSRPSCLSGPPGAGLNNERGVVFIIVLIMLLLFSILGATLLNNTTTELRVSGNYRNQQQAFFAADGSFEQGQISNAIFSEIQNIGETWTGVITFTPAGTVTVTQNALTYAGASNTAQVVVENIGSGPPPTGSGFDETFQANFYNMDVTGSAPGNTEIEVNATIARMQAKAANY